MSAACLTELKLCCCSTVDYYDRYSSRNAMNLVADLGEVRCCMFRGEVKSLACITKHSVRPNLARRSPETVAKIGNIKRIVS